MSLKTDLNKKEKKMNLCIDVFGRTEKNLMIFFFSWNYFQRKTQFKIDFPLIDITQCSRKQGNAKLVLVVILVLWKPCPNILATLMFSYSIANRVGEKSIMVKQLLFSFQTNKGKERNTRVCNTLIWSTYWHKTPL